VLEKETTGRLPRTATPEAPEGWEAEITLRDTVLQRASAPNVAGILEGTDRALAAQYLVYSAHMDHIGISHGAADSINNGADDDASGTAGVLELAEAFAQPGARPRRSIIFLAVSGEEKGLWGSSWFTAHPPVPLAAVAADLNLDMIGRNWTDTVAVVGLEHSDLARRLRRTEAAHAELRMHAIPDPWPAEHIFFRSDHYNFARRGVPILFFTSGLHQDYHRPSDSADKIEDGKEARLLRLLFWLGEDVGNDPARPKWNPESYRTIVGR
jgi:Zn-dependent M28 family amino/carboxypeptidase